MAFGSIRKSLRSLANALNKPSIAKSTVKKSIGQINKPAKQKAEKVSKQKGLKANASAVNKPKVSKSMRRARHQPRKRAR